MTKKAKIIGTGSYFPQKVLTNADLEKMVETSDEWIVSRSGMKERRIASSDEFTSDMGLQAAKCALEDAKINGEEIDFIIFATLTPDYVFPSTAGLVQSQLKAKNAPAVDIQATCSGYLYGLMMAKAFVERGEFKNVLVIAADKLSSITNYKDRNTCILFGDGAAACVVSLNGSGFEIQSICLGSDGEHTELLFLPAGGCRNPATLETVSQDKHFIQMNGREVFKHAVRIMETASKEALFKAKLTEQDIAWVIPHQANERIIDAMAKRFTHLTAEKVFKEVVQKFGNTSASSIGIALDLLHKDKKFNDKENILLTVFGGGFTWGAAILTYELSK